ncbi:MAG TPA: multiheme c-type cytochrome [Chthonomonadaceae bacterium]|nr:multiheme c-type cytochrome [Chthonomonadaceae bacterium]
MHRKWLIGCWVALMVLTVALGLLAGCGGGGGPNIPPNQAAPTPVSPSAEFVALEPASQRTATYVGTAKCGGCHSANAGARIQLAVARARSGTRQAEIPKIDFDAFSHTMHGQKGVTCEHCHGPGSAHVAWATSFLQNPAGHSPDEADNNILTYPNITRHEVCNQCHGPIVADFLVSKHAQKVDVALEESVQNPSFLGHFCLRCHSGATRAEFIDYPFSTATDITTAQNTANAAINAFSAADVTEHAESTVETASCGNCHNPHKLTGKSVQKVAQSPNDVQLHRRAFNLDPTPVTPGAPLKVYSNFDQACGSCHNGFGANPSDANLKASTSLPIMHEGPQYSMLMGYGGFEGAGNVSFSRQSSHAVLNTAQCVQCHMPDHNGFASHTMTVMVDVSCAPCHSTADASSRATALKNDIENELFTLRSRMANWAQQTLGNSAWWDYTRLISESGGTPPSATQEASIPLGILRARHNYYFIVRDNSFGIHNAPYTRLLLDAANRELDPLVGRPDSQQGGASRAIIESVLRQDRARSKRAERYFRPGAI